MEINQAEKGTAPSAAQEGADAEPDVDAATAFKAKVDAKIKQLNDEAAALPGKDNKKARSEKSKQASALSKTEEYIDAELILKGRQPKNGNFIKKAAVAAPAAAAAPEAAAPAEEPAAED